MTLAWRLLHHPGGDPDVGGGGRARWSRLTRRGVSGSAAPPLCCTRIGTRMSCFPRDGAPDCTRARLAAGPLGIVSTGIFPAAAVPRRVSGGLGHPCRSGTLERKEPVGHRQAVISAHRNPADSRAMAIVTMGCGLFLRAARRRNRLQRRCWAVQDRAAVAGSTPSWRRRQQPHRKTGPVLVGPGRLDQLGAVGGCCRPW